MDAAEVFELGSTTQTDLSGNFGFCFHIDRPIGAA
jgi:hypothetical protein